MKWILFLFFVIFLDFWLVYRARIFSATSTREIREKIKSNKKILRFWGTILAGALSFLLAKNLLDKKIFPIILLYPLSVINFWNYELRMYDLNFDATIWVVLLLFATGFFFSRAIPQKSKAEKFEKTWGNFVFRKNLFSAKGAALVGILAFAFFIHKISLKEFSWWSILLWLFPIFLISFSLFKRDAKTGISFAISIEKIDLFWLTILLMIGLGIGSYKLTQIPSWQMADEGAFFATAKDMLKGVDVSVLLREGIYTFPAVSSLYVASILHLFGQNLWAWRFASVLAGSLTILPLYFLVKILFNRKMAILTSWLMMTNPYYLSFSRLGYNNSQALFPITLAILLFVLAVQERSYVFLWLSGLVAGLAFYTYPVALLGVSVIFIMIAIMPKNWHVESNKITLGGIVLSSFLMVALPRIIYMSASNSTDVLHFKVWETSIVSAFYGHAMYGDFFLENTDVFRLGGAEIFFSSQIHTWLLARGVLRTWLVLFSHLFSHEHFLISGLTGGTGFFFLGGLLLILRGRKNLASLIFSTWFFLGFFILGVLAAFPPRLTHLVAIIPAIAFLGALGMLSHLR